jgi:general secretion pathway protein G
MKTKTENRRRRQSGVTLIEMMVVVTIIALFSALVLPKMFRRADAARQTAARAQINGFLTALGAYKLDTSTFPTTEQGLGALRVAPAGVPLWKGPYLPQEVPLDPWGRPYVYKYPGEHGDEPDIVSLGADGTPGGEEINADILSWKNQ